METDGGAAGSARRCTRESSEHGATRTSYRAEVHLQARMPIEDWTAVLTGRLDGCIERAPGEWLIEELKSTNLSVEGIRPSGISFERDRRQLLAYCSLISCFGYCC